jgi:hypothetical protein
MEVVKLTRLTIKPDVIYYHIIVRREREIKTVARAFG